LENGAKTETPVSDTPENSATPFSPPFQQQDLTPVESSPDGGVSVTPTPLSSVSPLSNEQFAAINQMPNLGGISAHFLSAATTGGAPSSSASGKPSFFSPQDVQAALKNLGNPEEQKKIEQKLSEAEGKTLSTLTPEEVTAHDIQGISDVSRAATVNPVLEEHLNIAEPLTREDAIKLRKYAESRGYENLQIVPWENDKTGNLYKIDWAPAERAVAAREAKKETSRQREEIAKNANQLRIDRLVTTTRSAWEKSPEALALTDPSKGKRANMVSFMQDYANSIANLTSQGIPQMGMLDSYARMESGGKVTEQQAQMALHANNAVDKFNILFGSKLTGQILAESQVKEMRKKFLQSYNATADLANSKGLGFNDQLAAEKGLPESTRFKPYVSNLVFREDFSDAIKEYKSGAEMAEKALKEAKINGNKQDAEYYQSLIDENKQKATQLLKWLKASNEPVLGMHDVLNARGQGFSGATEAGVTQTQDISGIK
jgi:hypothetical protein